MGAIVGAVVGGVIGAVLVKKRNALKKPLGGALPKTGKAALAAVKAVAHDAMEITKVSAEKAADEALSQIKATAQDVVIGVATGEGTSRPAPTARPSGTETKPARKGASTSSSARKPRGKKAKSASPSSGTKSNSKNAGRRAAKKKVS